MSAFDEAALLENARLGDEHAFAELTGTYQGELRAYCYRMLGSVQDAEDAVQNALLRAWRGLDKFEGRSSIRSWLYAIATNTTLDITRSAIRPPRPSPPSASRPSCRNRIPASSHPLVMPELLV